MRPHPFGFGAPRVGFGATLPRGAAIFSLREPSRRAAGDDADHHRADQHDEQRRVDRESGYVARREGIERDGDEMAIGEGENQQDDRDGRDEDEFEEANQGRNRRLSRA